MLGAITPLPNTYGGAYLKHRDNFIFILSATIKQSVSNKNDYDIHYEI
jgi:hypothetical protein